MGSIDSIETLGLVDGPGIRVVVFLNGCTLRCKYCHNPEMWSNKEDNYSAEDLVNKIINYKPYFKNNGGVTFSGGEPLIQSEFLKECCKLLKKNEINIALDTAGVGNDYDEILDYIDLVILDIKAINSADYKEMTGLDDNKSLEFLKKCQEKEKKLWIRHVIIPGVNDSKEYILKFKEYIKDIKNIEKIELLPYHSLANTKYEKLNIDYVYKDIKDMDIDKCKELERLLTQ